MDVYWFLSRLKPMFAIRTLIILIALLTLATVSGTTAGAEEDALCCRENKHLVSSLEIESCKNPFSIKILDKGKAIFNTHSSGVNGLEVNKYSVHSKGLKEKTLVFLFTSELPDIKMELRSYGQSKESWQPVKVHYLMNPDSLIQNEFNPPENVSVKTLKFMQEENQKAITPPERIKIKTLDVAQNPYYGNKLKATDLNEEGDDSGKTVHGFLDISSVFYLMNCVLLIVGFILLIKYILKKKK